MSDYPEITVQDVTPSQRRVILGFVRSLMLEETGVKYLEEARSQLARHESGAAPWATEERTEFWRDAVRKAEERGIRGSEIKALEIKRLRGDLISLWVQVGLKNERTIGGAFPDSYHLFIGPRGGTEQIRRRAFGKERRITGRRARRVW